MTLEPHPNALEFTGRFQALREQGAQAMLCGEWKGLAYQGTVRFLESGEFYFGSLFAGTHQFSSDQVLVLKYHRSQNVERLKVQQLPGNRIALKNQSGSDLVLTRIET